MKYMLMIFDRADAWETATEQDIAAVMDAHAAFGASLAGRGGEFSGEACTRRSPPPPSGPIRMAMGRW